MIVTAEEVNRSLRGTLDLLNRRVEGLRAFDMSERGFWRSFAALWLTLPAYVVTLAFERLRLGMLAAGRAHSSTARASMSSSALGHVGELRRPADRHDLDHARLAPDGSLRAVRDRDELDHRHGIAGALRPRDPAARRMGARPNSRRCSPSPSRSSSCACNGSPRK